MSNYYTPFKESIDNYSNLFAQYINNIPTLKEALIQMFKSSGEVGFESNILAEEILSKVKAHINNKFKEIQKKYPNITLEEAQIISSYTCELSNDEKTPYRLLNENLVSNNRSKGISKISKYLFILLRALRKLKRYYPSKDPKCLYRSISKNVDLDNDFTNTKKISYKIGNTKTFWGFTSTCPNPSSTFEFLGKKGNSKLGTLFTLTGNVWGYDIKLFNVFYEDEILLEPERKIKIIEIIPPLNDIIHVRCEVLDSPLVLENIIKTDSIKQSLGYEYNKDSLANSKYGYNPYQFKKIDYKPINTDKNNNFRYKRENNNKNLKIIPYKPINKKNDSFFIDSKNTFNNSNFSFNNTNMSFNYQKGKMNLDISHAYTEINYNDNNLNLNISQISNETSYNNYNPIKTSKINPNNNNNSSYSNINYHPYLTDGNYYENKSVKLNINSTQVITFKHNHGLVLLLSNMDWKCKECFKYYSNENPTYYCSLCDFRLCNNCIGYQKKYPLKIYCHQQTKLKIYNFLCHNHPMIYCRTSRDDNNVTSWNCNLCRKNYGDKIWSFYCTQCDYDICLSCSRKYLPDYDYINKIGITIDNHPHSLVYMITKRNWICNLCRKKYDNYIPTYYCSNCDYDVCESCMKKLSDEERYPLSYFGNKLNYNIKRVNHYAHDHTLIYCITSRSRKFSGWICNECHKSYGGNDWSLYCSLCDYDICNECYDGMKLNLFSK